VLKKVRSGGEKLMPLEDVVKQYGLDD